ncbi:MAG TPA: hypothetical protein ENH95_02875 [Nitrosopumilus sp.]|nr:hypothetical protein [Nitrosopumilus sp.]
MINSKEAKREHRKLKSYWSSESRLTQKVIIALLEKLELMTKKNKPKKPSKWNKLVGKYLKEGKTIQEAAVEWKKRIKVKG